MDISITKNSKEHKLQFRNQWKSAFQMQLQLNSLQNIQDEGCSSYRMIITIFLLYFFQILFYVVKQYLEIYMFLYIQATQLSLQWMSLDCKVAILSWRKQSTSISVVNVNLLCIVIFAVDAEPWNNRVCQYSVLLYLFSRHQYRTCI